MVTISNELTDSSVDKKLIAKRDIEKDLGTAYCNDKFSGRILSRFFFVLFALGNLLYPRNLTMVTISNELPDSSVDKTLTAKRAVEKDLSIIYFTG